MSYTRSPLSQRTTHRRAGRQLVDRDRLLKPQLAATAVTPQAASDPRNVSAHSVLALQGAVGNRAVQRLIQRSSNEPAGNESQEQKLESQLNQTVGEGQPLPKGARHQIESRLGADLSRVRVHTDRNAREMNQAVSAQAFTRGHDIYFDKGCYNPSSTAGQRLLAHELTHVVQQRGTDGRASGAPANTIQRYTIVDNYTKKVRGPLHEHPTMFNEMFKKQRLNTDIDNSVLNQRTYNMNWEEGHFEASPELKVSENGMLAMENTSDQPKVFYAHPNIVAGSRKRLKDIGSQVTLEGDSSKKLKVPQKPEAPNGMRNSLVMVKPAKMDPLQLKLMDANQCDSVASKIIGPKLVAIGTGNKTLYPESFSVGSSGDQAARALGEMEGGEGPQEFKKRFMAEQPKHAGVSKAIQKKFSKIKKKCKINEQVLEAISHPQTPPYVIEQVYRAYWGKTAETKPNTSTVINYIESQYDVPMMQAYGNKVRDEEVPESLGLNQDAMPDVGEAFSITESGPTQSIVDEAGLYKGNFDFTSTSELEQEQALESLQTLQEKGGQLNRLRSDLFTNYKKGTTFREHHAAVVARDGSDSVTFENYNRAVEDRYLYEDRWNKLAEDFDNFDEGIAEDIEEARNDGSLVPELKMYSVREAKKRELLRLKDNLTDLQGGLFVQLRTNFSTVDKNELWHFKMYGPKGKVDDEGKGQSFHDVWSPSIKNPVTFRTTGRVDGEKVTEFKNKIDQKVTAKQLLLVGNQPKLEMLVLMKAIAHDNLDHQKTAVGASKTYRDVLDQIEQL